MVGGGSICSQSHDSIRGKLKVIANFYQIELVSWRRLENGPAQNKKSQTIWLLPFLLFRSFRLSYPWWQNFPFGWSVRVSFQFHCQPIIFDLRSDITAGRFRACASHLVKRINRNKEAGECLADEKFNSTIRWLWWLRN
jgi:hypothetical protein